MIAVEFKSSFDFGIDMLSYLYTGFSKILKRFKKDYPESDRKNHSKYWAGNGPTPAYRENVQKIKSGTFPERYARILPFVKGNTVLEIGAGECLLSILLAKSSHVKAIDSSIKRCQIGRSLYARHQNDSNGGSLDIICGDIMSNLNLVDDVETIVMNRTIYHLHEDIKKLFQYISEHNNIKEVVLIGNQDKQKEWEKNGHSSSELGEYLYYATIEGMTHLLNEFSFSVEEVIYEYDPIVRGVR